MPRYHDDEDDDDEGHIDMRPLLRIGVWGCCAVVALGGVVFAGRTDAGADRAKVALAALREAPREMVAHPGNLLAARSTADEAETKRLNEAVRKLTADRDRLATRVATLEQNLNDLTGSISRAQPPAQSGAPAPAAARSDDKAETFPPPAPPDMASTSSSGDTPSIAPQAPPADQPVAAAPAAPTPRQSRMATIQSYVTSSAPPVASGASESRVATATPDTSPPADTPMNGFAIDLGSATTVNTLRAHWSSIRAAHPAILEGMRPLVSVRQSSRPGFTEFHLVAGPIADADGAAKMCQLLTAARVPCRPSTFDGQRLELR